MNKITFNNQPKLSKHEIDSKFNERKRNLIPQVENFISNHPRFKEQEVDITFSHKGVSSLVCIIETSTEKLVLKIRLSIANNAFGEGQFLKIWEASGIKVPHVFEEGVLNGHSYALMEYINAPILADTYSNEELLGKRIYLPQIRSLFLTPILGLIIDI